MADEQEMTQALAQAAPEEIDAHKNFLQAALGELGGQGVNVAGLLGQAGVGTTDPNAMSHGDLLATTLALARQHPEVVAMIAARFPQAQGLITSVLGGSVLGGTQPQTGGAPGGLLGRFGL